MDGWLGWLLALGALLLLAPAMAWLGRKHARSIRGTAGLAMVLLGFGQVFDPPRRHMIEAIEGEEQDTEASGEPKDAAGGS